jgi:tetratricopeptide (TPR) repeat protein/predicted Ser/Thr protein kinase
VDSARWETLQSLFHQAADLPSAEQRRFLERACEGDGTLVADVLAMLAQDRTSDSMLDRDVAHVAERVLPDALPSTLAEQPFGPYRLTRKLGEGGMGVVYLGVRDDLGTVAAIKILRDAWLSPARRERFALEQRVLAQLNHPSIARLYDADTLRDGTPWFVMEYVEGEPLTTYCRSRSVAMKDRLRLFRDVCEAVQHAHRNMVVHRDLKPSNILVAAQGAVKLLDFGVSKQLDVIQMLEGGDTRTSVRLMTPQYAAPEQIRGGATGVHTDVYALGVILYELLTDRLPYDVGGGTVEDAERVVLTATPEKPSTDSDLDVLCLTAMHKDRERRYASVEALTRDVDHFLNGEPLEARPDSAFYRTSKFVRRHRAALAAVAAVVLVVASLIAFYTVRLARARDAALAESVRTQRVERFMLDLFNAGEKEAGPADNLKLVTVVDRGVLQASALDREPLLQAELFETLGGIYRKLGRFDDADRLLQSSLDTRRSHAGPESADVVRGLVAVALLRGDQARVDEAEKSARDALAIARKHFSADQDLMGLATDAVGEVLSQRGAYDTSIAMLSEALRLRSAPGAEQAELASTLFQLASVHFYAGHFDESEALNQRVLEMHRQLYGERHPLVAEDIVNLGAIQYEHGKYADAERLYRDGLAINEHWYGPETYPAAATMTMLGRALEREDRLDEAESYLRHALTINEQTFGNSHPRVASALNDLGNVAMMRGKPAEAEPHFRRIGEIYRATYGEQHYLVGIASSNLAGVYMARNEFKTAEAMYRSAIETFTKAQSPDHLNTGIARIKLGRSLLKQRRYDEAEREVLTGYGIVSKQAAPTVSWLKNARDDLIAIYDALHTPEKAERFRAEAARLGAK